MTLSLVFVEYRLYLKVKRFVNSLQMLRYVLMYGAFAYAEL